MRKEEQPSGRYTTILSHYQNLVPINPGITLGRITELCWRISLSAFSKILQLATKELPLSPLVHTHTHNPQRFSRGNVQTMPNDFSIVSYHLNTKSRTDPINADDHETYEVLNVLLIGSFCNLDKTKLV